MAQHPRSKMIFLKEFLANPGEVASVVPSSQRLADVLLDQYDYAQCKVAVEYGPGTGVFTRPLRERLPRSAHFVVAEPNPNFHRYIAQQNLGIVIVPDYAQNIVPVIQKNYGAVDLVISGLPYSMMPYQSIKEIFAATHKILRPGGEFRLFVYWHTLFVPKMRKMVGLLEHNFESVNKEVVWGNFPPATVIRCVK